MEMIMRGNGWMVKSMEMESNKNLFVFFMRGFNIKFVKSDINMQMESFIKEISRKD